MSNTKQFRRFMRGVGERRHALLRKDGPRTLLYPPIGTIWDARRQDLARCDAFILFFVAEIEYYFESVLELMYSDYGDVMNGYFLKECSSSVVFFETLQKRRAELSRNNNANWTRVSSFFEFVGMGRETHFPDDFWVDVDSVVSHRGHVAHNGARIRSQEDRREIIRKIEVTIKRVKYFDQHLVLWREKIAEEKKRISSLSLVFRPPKIAIV